MLFVTCMRRITKILNLNKEGIIEKYPMSVAPMSR